MAEERIYTIPLQDAYTKPSTKRAKRAVVILRSFVSRHMKVPEDSVSISSDTNSLIWRDGMKKPPRRIKVKVSKDKETVKVTLLDEKERADKIKARGERKSAEKKARADKRAKEKKDAPKPANAPHAANDKAKAAASASKAPAAIAADKK
jgi:large subunit ribosomal protein L31e